MSAESSIASVGEYVSRAISSSLAAFLTTATTRVRHRIQRTDRVSLSNECYFVFLRWRTELLNGPFYHTALSFDCFSYVKLVEEPLCCNRRPQ